LFGVSYQLEVWQLALLGGFTGKIRGEGVYRRNPQLSRIIAQLF